MILVCHITIVLTVILVGGVRSYISDAVAAAAIVAAPAAVAFAS